MDGRSAGSIRHSYQPSSSLSFLGRTSLSYFESRTIRGSRVAYEFSREIVKKLGRGDDWSGRVSGDARAAPIGPRARRDAARRGAGGRRPRSVRLASPLERGQRARAAAFSRRVACQSLPDLTRGAGLPGAREANRSTTSDSPVTDPTRRNGLLLLLEVRFVRSLPFRHSRVGGSARRSRFRGRASTAFPRYFT